MTPSHTTTLCTAYSDIKVKTDFGHFLALKVGIDLHLGLQFCHQ